MKNGKVSWKSSDKRIPSENLQEFLQFKRRGSKAPDKKKYQRRDKHHLQIIDDEIDDLDYIQFQDGDVKFVYNCDKED